MTIRRLLISALCCAAGTALFAMNAEQQKISDNPAETARRPAPTLSRPTTPAQAPDEEGFIRRWLILEPIGATGLTDSAVQAAVRKEYFPGQFTAVPHDGDRVRVNGSDLQWHALDSRLYNINLYHFAYALGKPTSNVLFWAVTIVNCPHEIKDVRLAIGSNAASVWWVNGKEVIGIYGDRQAVIDDGASKRITLKKGLNVVRAAVVNGGGATDFCARFLDRNDSPVKGFSVNLGELQNTAGALSPWADPISEKGEPAGKESEKNQFEPPKPGLEFMARFEVNLDAPVLELGQIGSAGKRRIIPITGGRFSGPRLNGTILNNGADWQLVAPDGLAYLDTRYALKTDDGELIYIQTRGYRYGPADVIAEVAKGNPVDPNKYYFRVYIQFETGSARYAWLNRTIGIGAGMRLRNSVIYDAYIVR